MDSVAEMLGLNGLTFLQARRARLSDSLRECVHRLIAQCQLAVAQLTRWLQLGWNALWRYVQAAPPPRLDDERHLCLDEVLYREPRQYLTVLSCADGRALVIPYGGARFRLLSAENP